MSKADYVRSQGKHPLGHTCHWPGCETDVPPAMWGCKKHWFKLPLRLRNLIWKTYQPGQEITKDPSADYLAAAREVQNWIRDNADRFAGTFVFYCDGFGCQEELDTGEREFDDAHDARMRAGWHVHKGADGEWEHFCPDCEQNQRTWF